MEVLVLDGKNYVKASKAARELGYATDYVGQLCRSGQIDAHLIGRTWYVNQDELGNHKVEKKRISRVKAREYAKRTIEEFKKEKEKKLNTAKNIDIQYENDSEELIPTVRKLDIQKETRIPKIIDQTIEKRPKQSYTIENEGDRVQLSGDIAIVDVTDGEIDDETVLMHAKISRRRVESPKNEESNSILPEPSTPETLTDVAEGVDIEEKPNFLARLEESGTDLEAVHAVQEVTESTSPKLQKVLSVPTGSPKHAVSSLPYILVGMISLVLSFLSIFMFQEVTYDSSLTTEQIKTTYTFEKNPKEFLNIILLKI